MKKVLIFNTDILCAYFQIPNMEDCGPLSDRWTKTRIDQLIAKEEQEKTLSFLSKSIPNKNNEFVIWIKQMQEKYDDEKFKEFTDKAMEVISNLSDELMEEPIGSDSTKILPSVNDMGNILLK